MSDTLMAVLFAVVFIGGPFFLLWLLDRRAKANGPLFSGPATPTMRILALLLGILFAGLFLVESTSLETIRPAFAILALALLGYSLGAGRPLRTLQGKRREGSGDTLNALAGSVQIQMVSR